jgi:uncharacterized damage-inducible protein DinB
VDQKTLFLTLWDKEAPTTHKVLSRIPEGSDYRPDPKSRPARELAWLIVREQQALVEGLERGRLEWEALPAPATMQAVLEGYAAALPDFSARLRAIDPARWEANVPFVFQGEELMNAPGYEQAWGFFLDVIHHRGQITTYLRAMGSTVPQIYGPSADEPL